MVLGDVYDLWSFVATHVKLWKSLKEHDVFIADLKRLGSDDNKTSTADGVSPLKHVGPITKFDKLYKTHKSHNTLPELQSIRLTLIFKTIYIYITNKLFWY